MSFDRFEIISTLYNTLQNSLKLVRKKDDGKLYTIKSVKVDENSQKEKELFFNELRILVPLTHKNIIWYKEAFYDKETKSLNMVIEYVDGGDLSMKIKLAKEKKLYFKEKVIWRIFVQILEGINYLHKKFIIHRDLKTSNIYLTKKGIVKITGLNVGKNIEDIGMALTQIGTPYFTAPEIWEQKPYDYKCDIWSMGCILYEMTTLHVPFLGLDMKELYQNILNSKYKPIPNFYSKELNEIIKLTLNKNQMERPSSDNLLNNKIILKKIKELKIKINFNDENSCINKAVNKIVSDYNKKIKKLENSHIIYKKLDNNNINQINSKGQNKNKIHIFNNSNNNYQIDNLITNSNSEMNKEVNINKLKKKKINNLNNNTKMFYNNIKDNIVYKDKNITEYNTKRNENNSHSALNQKIYSSVISNSTGKMIDKINNKLLMSLNNNNFFRKNIIPKININRNNGIMKNLPNSYNGINLKKDINKQGYKNNGIKYKYFILNKSLENKSNIMNKILIDNNITNNNNSFNNKNNLNININNNSKKINKINKIDNMENQNHYKKIYKKENPNYHYKYNFNQKEINNIIDNNDLDYKFLNLTLKNKNNIYLNSKSEDNNLGYNIPIKSIKYNVNKTNTNTLKGNKILKKNNKIFFEEKVCLNPLNKFSKNNSNRNMIINKNINNKKLFINNKINNDKKRYLNIKRININRNDKKLRIYCSPTIKRNYNSFIIKNENNDLAYSFKNPNTNTNNNIQKKIYLNNTGFSEKNNYFFNDKINLERYYISTKKNKSLKNNNLI